jgi:hypothetical protein
MKEKMKQIDKFRLWNAHRKWWKAECKPFKPRIRFPLIEVNIWKK